MAFGAGERMTATIFLAAWRFADDQGGAGRVALGEDQIAGGVSQGAAVEASQGGSQALQGGRLTGQGECALARGRLRRWFGDSNRAYHHGDRLGFRHLKRAQPVDGARVDRLVSTPFDLQA